MESGDGEKKSNPIEEAAKFSSSSFCQNAKFATFLFWPKNLEFVLISFGAYINFSIAHWNLCR
jgi:hypothetical protein